MTDNSKMEQLIKMAEANIIAIDKMRLENKEIAKENEKERKEANKSMKKLEKMFDGMGYTQGMITENLVGENFIDVFEDAGENITSINRNVVAYDNKKQVAEFDVIGINGTKVFVGETKTKLTKNHIDKFVEKTLPKFEKYLLKKRYAGLKLYGVLGARVIDNKETKRYALEKGLYLVVENHKGKLQMDQDSVKKAKFFA
ncbi:MAG: hypothetical protein Q9M94_05050 [Candidatus Gracilibacteria bacterium]|nr:hypothetical protein [Candidatus Gracilibacteria bacterium]